ncbi:NAD-dependent epimerase/dehydratase family protein [Tomitella biformata]|uniref:NAD-dependent epimerase/dehydratase family protein n=1 Tax=Tomitella biformata TaxID=630403 RepID=UPI000465150C|nr:NAD(P)-dependent oxidoreductase [Tomitella biformata]
MSDFEAASGDKVVVLGGAGVTGTATLPRLVEAGYAVTAHSRSPRAGGGPVTWASGDIITDRAALRDLLDGAAAVFDLRVALPTSLRTAGAIRQYKAVRDTAVREVVDACMHLGVPRLVHDTVTMVYRDGGDRWLDEDSPVNAPGPMKANLAGEEHLRRFTEGGGIGVDLRLGMLHGDDPMTAMIENTARKGWLAIPGRRDGYLSMLPIEDAGAALAAALAVPAGIYNVAAEPITRANYGRALAEKVGRASLRALPGFLGGPLGRSQRVSSAKFRAAAGWAPA